MFGKGFKSTAGGLKASLKAPQALPLAAGKRSWNTQPALPPSAPGHVAGSAGSTLKK